MRLDSATLLVKSGVQFAVLQAVFAAAFLSDNLIVGRIFGPAAVAQYSVHAQLFGFAPLLAGLALSPFWPAYGEALARGDVDWVQKTLLRSLLATVVLVGGASALLLVTGDYLIQLWVGSRIAPSPPLMVGLAVWATLSSIGTAVNADILLLSEFPSALRKLTFREFLLFGRRRDLDVLEAINC